MQSQGHVVYNVESQKIALSYADDKRAWYSNNLSLPYGHYDDDDEGANENNDDGEDDGGEDDDLDDDDGEDDNEEGEPPAKMIKLH